MNNSQKNILIFYSVIIIFSYFFGYIFNENSIGSGGYKGDLSWIWNNYEIFRNKDFIDAIKDEGFFGNRTQLLYIINFYLNPFLDDIDNYRLSITFFSILAPIIFYLCLVNKFRKTNHVFLVLISLLILLSPFYRTSAFWGMEIQYGIISALLAIYFISKKEDFENISLVDLFLSVLFSACTVYFDLKLIFIPIYIYLKIIFSNLPINKKIFSSTIYFIFTLPFIFLIYLWGGIVPTSTQVGNPLQGTHPLTKFHLVNILFATNIIGFYMFPILIFKKDILKSFKKLINQFNIIIFTLFLFYLVYFLYFDLYEFTDKISRVDGGYKDYYGLGYSLKLGNLFFEDRTYSLIFNILIYLLSVIIILLVVGSHFVNLIILLFFYFISIFLFPLMQEYFDPYIFLISILLFKNNYDFNFKNCSFVFLFFSIFLISSIYYYQ